MKKFLTGFIFCICVVVTKPWYGEASTDIKILPQESNALSTYFQRAIDQYKHRKIMDLNAIQDLLNQANGVKAPINDITLEKINSAIRSLCSVEQELYYGFSKAIYAKHSLLKEYYDNPDERSNFESANADLKVIIDALRAFGEILNKAKKYIDMYASICRHDGFAGSQDMLTHLMRHVNTVENIISETDTQLLTCEEYLEHSN